LWSSAYVFTKVALYRFTPASLGFLRCGVAAAVDFFLKVHYINLLMLRPGRREGAGEPVTGGLGGFGPPPMAGR